MNVFLLAGPTLNEFQLAVLRPFLSTRVHPITGCLVDVRKPVGQLERLRRNLRRGRGGYVFVMAARSAVAALRQGHVEDTRELVGSSGISVVETTDPYSPKTLDAISDTKPDVLLLIGGFGILKQPLLQTASHGVLGYHHGDMRRYRGQPPAFWELYNGEKEMGITVQRLSPGLDSGEPIVEKRLEIHPTDTVRSLRARALDESTEMMFEAVNRLDDPAFAPGSIDSFGPLYTLPNLHQWVIGNMRISSRVVSATMWGLVRSADGA